MLDRVDFANKVACLAKTDARLAFAAAETRRIFGPRPAQIREVRTELTGIPDVPQRLELRPQVCGDFFVSDFSYAIEWPDDWFAGSLFRGQAGIQQAKWPGIDVSIAGTGAPAYIFAQQNLIQAVADRLAGDQPNDYACETCWLIQYCDFLTVQFNMRRALDPTEVPLLVVLTWKGFELAVAYKDVTLGQAYRGLREMGYYDHQGG